MNLTLKDVYHALKKVIENSDYADHPLAGLELDLTRKTASDIVGQTEISVVAAKPQNGEKSGIFLILKDEKRDD
jgi:hypothetical protein